MCFQNFSKEDKVKALKGILSLRLRIIENKVKNRYCILCIYVVIFRTFKNYKEIAIKVNIFLRIYGVFLRISRSLSKKGSKETQMGFYKVTAVSTLFYDSER